MERIQQAGEYLDVAKEQVLSLQLVCEEILVHISDSAGPEVKQRFMSLRITDHEGDLTVEISCGQHLDDLKTMQIPSDLLTAEESQLELLGLALFRHLIKDFRQASLSGVSYIWFKLR